MRDGVMIFVFFHLSAIAFSSESMEKAVVIMNQLNSLVGQCEAYMQGCFDCPNISQPELYQR